MMSMYGCPAGSGGQRKGWMILQVLKSNRAQFEYDIHALVKAFYPAWELKIVTPESVVKDRRVRRAVPVMELEFGETDVKFTVYSGYIIVEKRKAAQSSGAIERTGKMAIQTIVQGQMQQAERAMYISGGIPIR